MEDFAGLIDGAVAQLRAQMREFNGQASILDSLKVTPPAPAAPAAPLCRQRAAQQATGAAPAAPPAPLPPRPDSLSPLAHAAQGFYHAVDWTVRRCSRLLSHT